MVEGKYAFYAAIYFDLSHSSCVLSTTASNTLHYLPWHATILQFKDHL